MKKKIEAEFEDYKWYLSSFFAYSAVAKKMETEEFTNFFDKILTLSKISQCLSDDSEVMKYTSVIEYNLNNLLYFIPLNEKISINLCIRNATEYLLKLIYFFQNPEEIFIGKGYRSLKDDKYSLAFYDVHKTKLDNLLQIYSSRSNTIHLKPTAEETVLTSLLEEKLTRDFNEKELNSITTDVNNCILTLLESICFYNISLSTQQKIILKKLVSKKWSDKINLIR